MNEHPHERPLSAQKRNGKGKVAFSQTASCHCVHTTALAAFSKGRSFQCGRRTTLFTKEDTTFGTRHIVSLGCER